MAKADVQSFALDDGLYMLVVGAIIQPEVVIIFCEGKRLEYIGERKHCGFPSPEATFGPEKGSQAWLSRLLCTYVVVVACFQDEK